MNRLSRYVASEIAVATFGAIGLFVLVFMTGNAIRDVLGLFTSGRIPASAFFHLLLLLLPFVLSHALPLGMVTGVLIALGRLSANREITAMRAAGLSLGAITFPVILFACIASGTGALFNLYLAPETRTVYKSTIRNVVRHDPVAFIRPGQFVHDFPGFIIYVDAVEGPNLLGFWIWELSPEGFPRHLIQAERGKIRFEESTQTLFLELSGGTVERRGSREPLARPFEDTIRLTTGNYTLELSLDRILGSGEARVRIKNMSLDQLLAERRRLRAEERDGNVNHAETISSATYRIHAAFANSLAILSLTIVAIPLGIRVGRKESYANAALALVLALVYFFLMAITSWFERSPQLYPQYLVHLPNLAFLLLGVHLFRRASRA